MHVPYNFRTIHIWRNIYERLTPRNQMKWDDDEETRQNSKSTRNDWNRWKWEWEKLCKEVSIDDDVNEPSLCLRLDDLNCTTAKIEMQITIYHICADINTLTYAEHIHIQQFTILKRHIHLPVTQFYSS